MIRLFLLSVSIAAGLVVQEGAVTKGPDGPLAKTIKGGGGLSVDMMLSVSCQTERYLPVAMANNSHEAMFQLADFAAVHDRPALQKACLWQRQSLPDGLKEHY